MKAFLAQACQNRFVIFDCLNTELTREKIESAYESLLSSRRDDALILTGARWEGFTLYAQMRVLGVDGAWGEFCGNGARACGAYLFSIYKEMTQGFLMTKKGAHLLKNYGNQSYSVRIPFPIGGLNTAFLTDPILFQKEYGFKLVETIEPHLVVEEKMGDLQLLALGRELNGRLDLFPLGINVNACHFLDENRLYVRTYERGVQRLTASCGTGSVACAFATSPGKNLEVITVGGPLELLVHPDGIELKGGAFLEDKW